MSHVARDLGKGEPEVGELRGPCLELFSSLGSNVNKDMFVFSQ